MLIEICLPSLPEIFARTNRFREIYPSDLSRAAGYKRISDIFSIVEVFDGNYRCRALVGKFSRFSSGPARPFNNNILRLIVIFFFHVRGFRAERRESVFFFFPSFCDGSSEICAALRSNFRYAFFSRGPANARKGNCVER